MKIYSAYSFSIAALLILTQFISTPYTPSGATRNVYVFAVALLHAIFGIWFLKGKDSVAFAHASAISRFSIGCVFVTAGSLQFGAMGTENFPLPIYLLLHGLVDLCAGGFTLWQTRQLPYTMRETTPLTLEYYNRFLFALYMIALSFWVLLHSVSFVGFFHLPVLSGQRSPYFPPSALQVFAILLLQLSFFNLVAVRHRIAPLIAAGMRGGLFTCVFVIVLVALRVVHPLVLLLPAVDLLSVAAIAISRLRHGRTQG